MDIVFEGAEAHLRVANKIDPVQTAATGDHRYREKIAAARACPVPVPVPWLSPKSIAKDDVFEPKNRLVDARIWRYRRR